MLKCCIDEVCYILVVENNRVDFMFSSALFLSSVCCYMAALIFISLCLLVILIHGVLFALVLQDVSKHIAQVLQCHSVELK